jgi:predicted CXXCH cytochrome family protein
VRTASLKSAATGSCPKKYIFICTLVLIAGKLLSGGAAYGNNISFDSKSDGPCSFALQLQNSPDRDEYISRLASVLASKQDSNVKPEDRSSRTAKTNPKESGYNAIDSFSKNCLSCHDGLVALNINAVYRNSPENFKSRNLDAKVHPIGMDYERYVALGRGYFKPIAMWNTKLILLNGKVGCLTCHNPLNPERKHLVMSDVRSTLCLTCHDK